MVEQANLIERLRFLAIDEPTRAALLEFRPLLQANIEDILDGFYNHVGAHPEAARIFTGGKTAIDHARKMQKHHWVDNVFTGQFDDAYFAQAIKIGQIHERVGLEPRWYMGGYCYTLNRLIEIAIDAFRRKPKRLAEIIAAINRAAFLDMDISISVYIDTAKQTAATKLNLIATDFETLIKAKVGEVGQSTLGIGETAAKMAKRSESSGARSLAVGEAAKKTNERAEIVSEATRQLAVSVNEIASQVDHSSQVARKAVTVVNGTVSQMTQLSESVKSIGDVVKLISAIAAKTNLLALNATIEAARAGEAGKGFAVVAGEVKTLANQTAQATENITRQVAAVQASTNDVSRSIAGVVETIQSIDQASSAIAGAVQQQEAATREISVNIEGVATEARDVSQSVADLSRASAQACAGTVRVMWSSRSLVRLVEALNRDVGVFLEKIRA